MRPPALAISAVIVLGLLSGLALPSHAMADVGFLGLDYTGITAPTGQKPQSKLWVVGDTWFASMYNVLTGDFEIYRLEPSTNSWSSTGTLVDERGRSSADVLWDGNHLYVVSASTLAMTPGSIRVSRYSYAGAAKAFTLDAGFPVTIHTAIIETVVIDKDTTGKLWITFTAGNQVHVAHSTTGDEVWTAPFALPVSGASNLDPDDISAIAAYNGKIGVMWSNQTESAMHFAYHDDGDPDSAWTRNTAVQQAGYADDHINLKALDGDSSGQLFAATKTSLDAGSASDPLNLLMVLGNDEVWRRYTFGTVSNNHTRPIVAIDRQNRQIYEFASSPCCVGGTIFYKQTSLDSPSFAIGLGTPFLQSSTDLNINNPTSTKQALNDATDLVAMASDDHTHHYWHNALDVAGGGQATPPATTDGSGLIGAAPQPDTTKPVIEALSLSPSAFLAELRGRGATRRPPEGTIVRYRLSEDAEVQFSIEQATIGRRAGRRCVRQTPANRGERSCTRYRRLRGGLGKDGSQGTNQFRFPGRLGQKRLSPGRYRLVGFPIDAARNRGKAARASFRILRPR